MTIHNQTSNPLSWGRSGPLFARPASPGILARFNAWRERRAAAAELASLSDRELADIGLTRQQIPQIISGRE